VRRVAFQDTDALAPGSGGNAERPRHGTCTADEASVRGANGAPRETDLEAIVDRHYGNDFNRKASIYVEKYERLFASRRLEPLRILELGVLAGASIFVWRDYFPNATIVGLDIRDRPAKFPEDERIHYVQGSQADPSSLDKAFQVALAPFDLIIDDASHIGDLTKRSFLYLFPKYLKLGGYYIIEDLGTSFLPQFPDGVWFTDGLRRDDPPNTAIFASHQNGMVGFVKQLVDETMKTLATGGAALPIESITIRTNLAVVKKA